MVQSSKKLSGLLLIAVVMLCSGCMKNRMQTPTETALGPGDYDFSLVHDSLIRRYLVHVPLNYDKNSKTPLVIYLHGGGGSMQAAFKDGVDKYSDKFGFILVVPAGTGPIPGRLLTWNGGKWPAGKGGFGFESCCGYASKNNVDDVGFISQMIEEVKRNFNVDENRIYTTGISNGGIMSYRLACEIADKIAAIAPVAPPAVPMNCAPSKHVPVMHIHGTADPCAPYDGGTGGGCLGSEKYEMQSAKDMVNVWKDINKCSDDSTIVYQKGDATCISYNRCEGSSEVKFCTIEGGGHTWPSGSQYLPEKNIGPVSYDISFDQIWEFFVKHPMGETQRDVDDFRALKKGMSYDEMVALVGEPDRDIGSGIHIYLYEMPDKSEVIVGGFVGEGLMYVKQQISNDKSVDIIGFGPGDYDFSLRHDGLIRTYKVHVLPNYDKRTKMPVVITLHGGYGNAEASQRQSGMSKTADREGFIVVYPEASIGPLNSKNGLHYQHWNGGPRDNPHKSPDIDDVGFISALLDKLEKDFVIDSDKIFATGISNGGTMVYRLACQLSNKIAAVAPVATNQLDIECNPSRPISIIHFHGLLDRFVPFKGGASEETLDAWEPVESTILEWIKCNGCSIQARKTYEKGGTTCITYSHCKQQTEVTLCTSEDGGHSWPSGTHRGAKICDSNPNGLLCKKWKEYVGPITKDISANDAMWEFFKKHPMR